MLESKELYRICIVLSSFKENIFILFSVFVFHLFFSPPFATACLWWYNLIARPDVGNKLNTSVADAGKYSCKAASGYAAAFGEDSYCLAYMFEQAI